MSKRNSSTSPARNAKYETPATTADVDREGLGAYILAKMNLGPAYVGGQFGYSSGTETTNGSTVTDPTKIQDRPHEHHELDPGP